MTAPPAVELVDAQRLLSLFAEGIAGRPFRLEPLDALPRGFRPESVPLVTGDGHWLYLPERVDDLDEARANLGLYKAMVMHQLGYHEFGTLAFDLGEARARIPALAARADGEAGTRARPTELERFFRSAGAPRLLRALFCTFEDDRVDAALARTYPGLRVHLARAMRLALERRALLFALETPAQLYEALVRCTLGDDPEGLRALDATGLFGPMADALVRVRAPGADVYTSAAAALDCADLLGAWLAGAIAFEESVPEAGPAAAAQLEGLAEGAEPVDFRGRPELELSQLRLRIERADDLLDALDGAGTSIPLELLLRLARELRLRLVPGGPDGAQGTGLPATGEAGGAPSAREAETLTQDLIRRTRSDRAALARELGDADHALRSYWIDEWDCTRGSYVRGWCRLFEERLHGDGGHAFLEGVRHRHRELFGRVRRQLQHARPDAYQRVRRVADGEEVDLDAAVEAHVDRRAGLAPTDRVYLRRDRARREVAAAFLVDLSASVSEPVPDPHVLPAPPPEPTDDYLWGVHPAGDAAREPERRILDIEKEALALMVHALEMLGDAYGIYGFSGNGRRHVEFHVAKELDDPLRLDTWSAIDAMRPRGYTRMGAALRHATHKLLRRDEARKILLLLSDGFPQDTDYGPDRNDFEYGIQDTAQALREAEGAGIRSYCVTVDRAGHDYLRRMCPDQQYLVIDEVESLPAELSKLYRTLTS